MYMLTTMLDQKYNYRKVVRQLDKFANRHRGLYGPGTLHSISETVKRDLVAVNWHFIPTMNVHLMGI